MRFETCWCSFYGSSRSIVVLGRGDVNGELLAEGSVGGVTTGLFCRDPCHEHVREPGLD